jgi:hypothetical protein
MLMVTVSDSYENVTKKSGKQWADLKMQMNGPRWAYRGGVDSKSSPTDNNTILQARTRPCC